MPPAEISGSAPPVALRKSRRRCAASGASGAPDRPPLSRALRERSGGRRDGGVADDQRVEPVVERGAGEFVDLRRVEVGRDLQEQRGRAGGVRGEAASRSVSAAPCCRSRRPGVFGLLMLIVT